MAVQVRFNGSALASLRLEAGEDALRPIANKVLNAARRNAPVDTGRLRASIAVEYTREAGRVVARVGSNLEYAIFQEEGTGVYGPRGRPITPVSAKVLRWVPKGGARGRGKSRYAFARSVRGTPAVHYLRDALNSVG